MYEELKQEAEAAFRELIELSHFRKGDLIVIGGSSSEIRGAASGKTAPMKWAPLWWIL